ncbi:hypothetical protein TWF281_003946 [Arthrobotrys megalospora]
MTMAGSWQKKKICLPEAARGDNWIGQPESRRIASDAPAHNDVVGSYRGSVSRADGSSWN